MKNQNPLKIKSFKDFNLDAPEEIEQIIKKAMAKSLDERYQSVRELLDDLKSYKEGIKPRIVVGRRPKPRILGIKKAYFYAGIVAIAFICVVLIFGLFIREPLLHTGRPEAINSINHHQEQTR